MDKLEKFFEERLLAAHANDTTRKDPFEKAGNSRGAPQGRTGFGTPPEKGIRVLKARWVDGDYDQGGAYWGYTRGDYIYAAVDSGIPCKYLRYTRATSREQAIKDFGLQPSQLLKK